MSGALPDASPASLEPSTALSNQERVDARRFCGYPAYGAGASGFQSWRFFQQYGVLEYRLTNLAIEEVQQVRQYLGQIGPLEQALLSASANLDTEKAAVFTRNPREMAERNALYGQWRRALCDFLGVPPGPAMKSNAAIVI